MTESSFHNKNVNKNTGFTGGFTYMYQDTSLSSNKKKENSIILEKYKKS